MPRVEAFLLASWKTPGDAGRIELLAEVARARDHDRVVLDRVVAQVDSAPRDEDVAVGRDRDAPRRVEPCFDQRSVVAREPLASADDFADDRFGIPASFVGATRG